MGRSMRVAVASARTTAPLGGVGAAALLAAAILGARARPARPHSRLEELSGRLARLEAQGAARLQSDRPRPRDVALGDALGLGLTALGSRVVPRHST